jgi:hypothetical protein
MTKRLSILLLVLVGLLIALVLHWTPQWKIYRLERRLGLVWLFEPRREAPGVPLPAPDRRAIRHAARAWVWQQFRVKAKQGHWRDSGYLLWMVLRPSPDIQGLTETNALVTMRQEYRVGVNKYAGNWGVGHLVFQLRLSDGTPIQISAPLGTGTNAAPMPYNMTVPPMVDKLMRRKNP